jgi:ankyrin repeat protein
VRVLLDAGADVDLVSRLSVCQQTLGTSALHRAAAAGHTECVRLLLAAGADARKADVHGNSPLIEASLHKHLECAGLLLPLSDLGHYTRRGMTAFHSAVIAHSDECFELLLPHITDVDVRIRAGVDENGRLLTSLATRLVCTLPVRKGCSTWRRLC